MEIGETRYVNTVGQEVLYLLRFTIGGGERLC